MYIKHGATKLKFELYIQKDKGAAYPVSIDVGGLDPGAMLHQHICYGSGATHGRPVQRCLPRVVRRIHVAPVLRQNRTIPIISEAIRRARVAGMDKPKFEAGE